MKLNCTLWRDLLRHTRLLVLLALLNGIPLHAQFPNLINYQGRLTDAQGNPVTGNRTMVVKVYDAPTGGNMTYEETIGSLSVSNGTYSFQFGSGGFVVSSANETIATTNGINQILNGTLQGTPIGGTVNLTDGNFSWSSSSGSSHPSAFSVTYNGTARSFQVIYLSQIPPAGIPLVASYQSSQSRTIDGALASATAYLALTVNGTEEATRARLLAVPFALKSADAQALAGKVESVSGNVTTIQSQTASLTSNLTALQGQSTGLSTNFGTLNSTVGALGSNVTALQSQANGLSSVQTSLNATVSALGSNVTALQGQSAALSSNVNTLQTQSAELSTGFGTLNTTVGALGSNVTALQGQSTTLNASVALLSANLSALSSNAVFITGLQDLTKSIVQNSGANITTISYRKNSSRDQLGVIAESTPGYWNPSWSVSMPAGGGNVTSATVFIYDNYSTYRWGSITFNYSDGTNSIVNWNNSTNQAAREISCENPNKSKKVSSISGSAQQSGNYGQNIAISAFTNDESHLGFSISNVIAQKIFVSPMADISKINNPKIKVTISGSESYFGNWNEWINIPIDSQISQIDIIGVINEPKILSIPSIRIYSVRY